MRHHQSARGTAFRPITRWPRVKYLLVTTKTGIPFKVYISTETKASLELFLKFKSKEGYDMISNAVIGQLTLDNFEGAMK